MKERPILFSGPMVRAILEGRKTQTRRIVKFGKDIKLRDVAGPYVEVGYTHSGATIANHRNTPYFLGHCPYGNPGDRLWVRETWGVYQSEKSWTDCGYEYDGDFIRGPLRGKRFSTNNPGDREGVHQFVVYRADGVTEDGDTWRPSIHMPRWASRITLEVVSVRVERLNDCSREDAIAEGIDIDPELPADPRDTYRSLWESINGPGSWDANPWVWVVGFKAL